MICLFSVVSTVAALPPHPVRSTASGRALEPARRRRPSCLRITPGAPRPWSLPPSTGTVLRGLTVLSITIATLSMSCYTEKSGSIPPPEEGLHDDPDRRLKAS